MMIGARGDLRGVGDRHHLDLAGEPRQRGADRIGHRAAAAGAGAPGGFVWSNPGVGAEPRSDSTTLIASRNRDSSPPEATFINGPGLVPGLVWTQNSMRSKPCGPGDVGSDSICVMNFARSSFSGASSALTALLSFSADFTRTAESLVAAAL